MGVVRGVVNRDNVGVVIGCGLEEGCQGGCGPSIHVCVCVCVCVGVSYQVMH